MFHILTFSWLRYLSYRNQPIDLQGKSMDWFLYDRDVHHARIKSIWYARSYFAVADDWQSFLPQQTISTCLQIASYDLSGYYRELISPKLTEKPDQVPARSRHRQCSIKQVFLKKWLSHSCFPYNTVGFSGGLLLATSTWSKSFNHGVNLIWFNSKLFVINKFG